MDYPSDREVVDDLVEMGVVPAAVPYTGVRLVDFFLNHHMTPLFTMFLATAVLRYLYCSSRHIKISCILCSQLGRVITNPTIRSQSDYVLTSSLASDQLDSVWKITSGMTWREFLKRVQDLDDYRFLMYDSVIASGNRWHEFKAPLAPKFRIEFKNQKAKKGVPKKECACDK